MSQALIMLPAFFWIKPSHSARSDSGPGMLGINPAAAADHGASAATAARAKSPISRMSGKTKNSYILR